MKKIFPIIALALITLSCEKEPDSGKLDSNFVVKTDYDNNFNFSSFANFYIPDSIMVISKKEKPDYWVEKKSEELINALSENMVKRGYTRVDEKEDARLGLQVSYIEDISFFSNSYNSSNWWWGYPGYWGPGYWGGWGGGWYYPYPVVYQYKVGSLLVEMVNLGAEEAVDKKLPVVWTAYMSGLLYGTNFNSKLAITAIDQAFIQSPYIKK